MIEMEVCAVLTSENNSTGGDERPGSVVVERGPNNGIEEMNRQTKTVNYM